jgi:hypothetical protein
MATGRLLVRNTLLNLGTGGVLFVLSLLFVPLMLGAFGAELYGVLTVTWMVLAHLGWLDLGFSRASARFVARDLALGRADRAALWGWTALLTQSVLGSCGALVLWPCAGRDASGRSWSGRRSDAASLRSRAADLRRSLTASGSAAAVRLDQRLGLGTLALVVAHIWYA